MDDTHEPRHSAFYPTNHRNIDQLHADRDRAGLHQLIDTLNSVTGWRAHDAARLIDEARSAARTYAAPRNAPPGRGPTDRCQRGLQDAKDSHHARRFLGPGTPAPHLHKPRPQTAPCPPIRQGAVSPTGRS